MAVFGKPKLHLERIKSHPNRLRTKNIVKTLTMCDENLSVTWGYGKRNVRWNLKCLKEQSSLRGPIGSKQFSFDDTFNCSRDSGFRSLNRRWTPFVLAWWRQRALGIESDDWLTWIRVESSLKVLSPTFLKGPLQFGGCPVIDFWWPGHPIQGPRHPNGCPVSMLKNALHVGS